jgi:hypothetical protein
VQIQSITNMKYGQMLRRSLLARESEVRFLLFQERFQMIFPLILIPFTTLVTINFANYIYRYNERARYAVAFDMQLSSLTKIFTLLSLNISLLYSLYL